MPKYYCDYCDTFLTHDSASVRKLHIEGVRHQAAVRAYYAQLDTENQDGPDREAMRYEKMKDDAMQFMMMPLPMMGMGGYPPMGPPPNFMHPYPPYAPPASAYNNQGPPRRDNGWNDRPDMRGRRGPDEPQSSYRPEHKYDDRSGPYSDNRADQARGYASYPPRNDGRDAKSGGYPPPSSNPSYPPPNAPGR